MIFITNREYSVIFITDCLQTQKMHAAMQYHSGSASGMVENITNLETPTRTAWGIVKWPLFPLQNTMLSISIKYIYVCTLLDVSSSVSFIHCICSVEISKTLVHRKYPECWISQTGFYMF